MKDLIQIHYDNADRPTVSGRELTWIHLIFHAVRPPDGIGERAA